MAKKKIEMTKEMWDAYTEAFDAENDRISKLAEEQKRKDQIEIDKIVKVSIEEREFVWSIVDVGEVRKLDFTKEGIKYTCRYGRVNEKSKKKKWQYTTDSEKYREYFDELKSIVYQAKYYEPKTNEWDVNSIRITITFEDKTKWSQSFCIYDKIFQQLIDRNYLLEMVPEAEKEEMSVFMK